MRSDEDLLAVIDLIYQAVLDAELWPAALIKLADAMGVSQIAMPSFEVFVFKHPSVLVLINPQSVMTPLEALRLD